MIGSSPHLAQSAVSVSEQASEWFARLQSGKMTTAQLDALEHWLKSDPAHRSAYEQVAALWAGIEPARRDPSVMAMRERARRAARRRVFGLFGAGAVAACAVAAAFVALRPVEGSLIYSTRVGQESTVGLPDGSMVMLDTDSAVRVYSKLAAERRVEVLRGRAMFEVAKDHTRPFNVHTQNTVVTAVGTKFAVQMQPNGVKVVLVEGKVRVQPDTRERDAAPVSMTAGYQLVSNQGAWSLSWADTERETAWVDGNLVFEEQRLAEVVEALNRYSLEKIVIADAALNDRRISAVMKTGDTAAFLRSLQTLGIATVRVGSSGEPRLYAK